MRVRNVVKHYHINKVEGVRKVENKVDFDGWLEHKVKCDKAYMNVLDDLHDRVQQLRENGETDMRSVLQLIEMAMKEVKNIKI